METRCWNLCERNEKYNIYRYWTQESRHVLKLEKGNSHLISETWVFPYGGNAPPPYSMDQSVSWENNGLQLVKIFPEFYGTRKFITAFTSPPPPTCPYTVPARSSPFPHIPLLEDSSYYLLPSLRFSNPKPVYASPLPHTRYMRRPSHSSRFYHPNNIGWGQFRWSRDSVLASGTQVRVFAACRSRRIFRAKIPQHAFLRRGSKAVGPMS
jgi:hypothetical protein